jgi:DNA-binding transcriptional ArsR family regulator
LKSAGRIRYIGITHYSASAFAEVESVLRSETLDFLQINYAMNDTAVERRILPLAADRGVAVIVNQPFGGGGLLGRLNSRPLASWAPEIDCQSWAQVLLKFVLSHPAVTCAIPGTGRPEHLSSTLFALADPTRRGILARLATGDATVKELAQPYEMSLAAVSKHLKVLETAGLVSCGRDAQWRPRHLEAAPFREVVEWLESYRRFWDRSLDSLAQHLKVMQKHRTKD